MSSGTSVATSTLAFKSKPLAIESTYSLFAASAGCSGVATLLMIDVLTLMLPVPFGSILIPLLPAVVSSTNTVVVVTKSVITVLP